MTDSWIDKRSHTLDVFKTALRDSNCSLEDFIWNKLHGTAPQLFPKDQTDMAKDGIYEKDWRIPVYVPEKNIITYCTWDKAGRNRLYHEANLIQAFHQASQNYSFSIKNVQLNAADHGIVVVDTFPQTEYTLASDIFHHANPAYRLKIAYNIGVTLGEFHLLTKQVEPEKIRSDEAWYQELYFNPNDILHLDAFTHDKKSFDTYRVIQLLKFFEEAQKMPIPKTYVHGDFRLHNMVINENTLSVKGIFDLECVHWNSPYVDMASISNSLSQEEKIEFLKAYQAVTKIKTDIKLLALYTAANQLNDTYYSLKEDINACLILGNNKISSFIDLKIFEDAYRLSPYITAPTSNLSAYQKLML